MEKDEFVIYQNTKGNILYSIGSFLFTIIGILGLFIFFQDMELVMQIILKAILFIGIIFFGYGSIYFLKRMKTKKEMLIVNSKGITDNTSAISLGFIPWEDIEDVYVDGVLGNNFNELKIKNEEKYLNNISFIKKLLINSNKKMGHQIVCITLNTTNYSINEVMEKIKEYRAK